MARHVAILLTLEHFVIIRNEIDLILHLETWMSRLCDDKVSITTCIPDHQPSFLTCRSSCRSSLLTLLRNSRLHIGNRSVLRDVCKALEKDQSSSYEFRFDSMLVTHLTITSSDATSASRISRIGVYDAKDHKLYKPICRPVGECHATHLQSLQLP
jgi:hypothetical protein